MYRLTSAYRVTASMMQNSFRSFANSHVRPADILRQAPAAVAGVCRAQQRGCCNHAAPVRQLSTANTRGVQRHITHSTAARAPSVKINWETDVAREALEHLKDNPTSFATGTGVLDSIIKIYTVYSKPDYFLPWQNHPKRESTGTGFVVKDRLIVTNAHVVADQTYVTVKRHGSGAKYRADVVAVGHDCDLALLTVTDPDFWVSPAPMFPLEVGEVPSLQESVLVCGYPTGGDNTSVTSGVVSRVEVTQYVHAASHLMAIQIDAAINPGNSGGPALKGDKVVGVAFQNLPNADNIGYIIPTPVLNRFLDEVGRYGHYRGFCSLGIVFQTMDNQYLRTALGMGPHQTGVLINRIQPTTATAQVLRKGDVLLEFDGVPIANDGTVHFRQRERIFFTSLITLKPTGSTAHLKVLRDGSEAEFDVVLSPLQSLVPVHKYDQLPSYFIYAGLVFVPLTQPYLHEYGDDWMACSPRRLVEKALNSLMEQPKQQIVILSQVLVDDINTGYQQFQNLAVLRVNGQPLLNLAQLRAAIDATPSPYVRLDLEDDRIIILDKALADEATERVQSRYRVPYLMSADIADAVVELPSPATPALTSSGNGSSPGAQGGGAQPASSSSSSGLEGPSSSSTSSSVRQLGDGGLCSSAASSSGAGGVQQQQVSGWSSRDGILCAGELGQAQQGAHLGGAAGSSSGAAGSSSSSRRMGDGMLDSHHSPTC